MTHKNNKKNRKSVSPKTFLRFFKRFFNYFLQHRFYPDVEFYGWNDSAEKHVSNGQKGFLCGRAILSHQNFQNSNIFRFIHLKFQLILFFKKIIFFLELLENESWRSAQAGRGRKWVKCRPRKRTPKIPQSKFSNPWIHRTSWSTWLKTIFDKKKRPTNSLFFCPDFLPKYFL